VIVISDMGNITQFSSFVERTLQYNFHEYCIRPFNTVTYVRDVFGGVLFFYVHVKMVLAV
jgi:hypothetical protein